MKLTVFILSLFVAGSLSATILDLVVKEVHVIVSNDRDLTVDHCTTKCDALFDLVDAQDESINDRMCHYACQCTIEPMKHTNCHHGHTTMHPTRAPHSTHFPHSTRFPHHTRPHIP